MKTLLLLRHGKSDWDANFARDLDRPLAPRGIKAARQVGEFLSATRNLPDRIFASPAVRARTTAEIAVQAGEWAARIETLPILYGGSPAEVLQEIAERNEDCESLLLAGHEPTGSLLCERLTGAQVRIPTACLVSIALGCERWADVEGAHGELRWLLPPRLLQGWLSKKAS